MLVSVRAGGVRSCWWRSFVLVASICAGGVDAGGVRLCWWC